MTMSHTIKLKLKDWAGILERLLYEVRPVFFLVFGLAAIFMTERNLSEILVGVILVFISGYALKARIEYRRLPPPE